MHRRFDVIMTLLLRQVSAGEQRLGGGIEQNNDKQLCFSRSALTLALGQIEIYTNGKTYGIYAEHNGDTHT